jgi:lipoprotein-anchoring transpeptidase ErfK/SrfK
MARFSKGLAKISSLATLAALALAGTTGCSKNKEGATADGSDAEAFAPAALSSAPLGSGPQKPSSACPKGACVAALDMQTAIYEKASTASTKLGYLRMGAVVPRASEPSPNGECPAPGGFVKIEPRGFVCVGKSATLDLEAPLVRASSVRPDLRKPLPYAYGFVRAVAPQYLRVPTKEMQLQSEMSLKEHMSTWEKKATAMNEVVLGANDVEIFGYKPEKLSTSMSQGELFGGQSDADPIPFWLENGKRSIPNVSGFTVPEASIFANRVRRHSGLAFVGYFKTDKAHYDRPFAITVDLRLIPTTKVKPDTGSRFHGVELEGYGFPMAFLRKDTDGKKARTPVKLTGKTRGQDQWMERELEGGVWMKSKDLHVARSPGELPAVAAKGEKWIDVSIENQVMVLWEGKKPVYATLVSTGQDGAGDPKTTKSTVQGTFRIKNKHVTATMDSNEKSGDGGVQRDKDGKQLRRGAGLFELRDVPWVQYFEGAYALHTAYWHDVFGTPRSHGCVNIAPIDARRVFMWSDPPVPEGWHGVSSTDNKGTTVNVRY